MPIAELLGQQAREHPDAEAIVDRDRRISFVTFDRTVDSIAAGFLSLGLQRGDRLAIWMPNHAEYLFSYLACARIGIVVVPLNIRLADEEVCHILENSGAVAIVTIAHFQGQDFVARSLAIRNRVGSLRMVISVGDSQSGDNHAGTIAFEKMLATSDIDQVRDIERQVDESDVALIIYTSGTTGHPKGAMISHGALHFYGAKAAEVGFFQPGDRVALMVPLATAAGSIIHTIPALQVGATLVMMDVFKAQESLRMIESERITCYGAPPTIFILQLNSPDFARHDLSSIRRLLIGAAPVTPDTVAMIRERITPNVTNAYGATETAGLVTWCPPGASSEHVINTSGRAIPGCEIKIVDADRRPVAAGKVGEIAVRAGSLMKGYYGEPTQTAEVMDSDGWWYSGDLGSLDDDGYLTIAGRRKEMYIRGGFNVYPAEIEMVLQKHPDILMSAVMGIPDPVLGEKGCAFIVPKVGDDSLTAEAVKEFCRANLADYKIPDQVVFRESMPLTGLGKIRKRQLLDELLGR